MTGLSKREVRSIEAMIAKRQARIEVLNIALASEKASLESLKGMMVALVPEGAGGHSRGNLAPPGGIVNEPKIGN